ncbi:MAG: DUF1190 domain-containing protein [Pseudohongiellaceae bacterium]|jgi:uncharacterized protein YgiB involved in biofilm formation
MSVRARKRSRSSTLIVMVPATTLLVSACGGPNRVEQGVVYQDAAECSAQNPEASEQCSSDYQAALAAHPALAPKYVSQEECEADFGGERCEPAPERHSQGSFYMPMMMGYLAGQMFRPAPSPTGAGGIPPLRDGQPPAAPAAASADRAQPLYKSRDDQRTFRTAGNAPVAERSGPVSVSRDLLQPRAAGLSRRGGFGATATRLGGTLGG